MAESSYRSACGKFSGAFLRALAKDSNKYTSAEFQIICLLRLNLKMPFIDKGMRCDCKNCLLVGEYGQHYFVCAKGGEWTAKHNRLSKLIQVMCARTRW